MCMLGHEIADKFQLTAARRRLAYQGDRMDIDGWFQLTAARRRLENEAGKRGGAGRVSTHSRPKAAGKSISIYFMLYSVSTHSRPKAAGHRTEHTPREVEFQLTAARRRLDESGLEDGRAEAVSTHSRPKAAG